MDERINAINNAANIKDLLARVGRLKEEVNSDEDMTVLQEILSNLDAQIEALTQQG
jgi:hypothetical protein